MRESGRTNGKTTAAGMIAAANSSVHAFLVSSVPVSGLRELIRKAENGTAVSLIVPDRYTSRVGLTSRYQQKLATAGGRLFVVEMRPDDWRRSGLLPRNLLVIDEQSTWRKEGEDWETIAAIQQGTHLVDQLARLQELGVLTELSSPDDEWADGDAIDETSPLNVYFAADLTEIKAGETVRLSWSVPGAERVTLEPGGLELSSTGSRLVRLEQTTEFILRAYRGAATKARVLRVKIDDRLDMDYHILAADPLGLRAPRRLPSRADMPGYFGTEKGISLTLVWNTRNAAAVWLDDQQVALSGRQVIGVTQKTIFFLRSVGIAGDEKTEKIVLNAFAPSSSFAVPEFPNKKPSVLTPSSIPTPTVSIPKSPLEGSSDLLAGLDVDTRKELEKRWRNRRGESVIAEIRSWFKTKKP